jgi:hypothetical protein
MGNSRNEHTGTSTVLTVRMPARLRELAQDEADREGITLSELIRSLVFDRVAPRLKGETS